MSALASSRRRSAGFGLIEILVAMTLTGLVLAAIAMVTAKWLPAWQRGLGRVQQSELVALALDRMAADLAAAAFLPAVRGGAEPLFEGSSERVVFVREVLAPGAARLYYAACPRVVVVLVVRAPGAARGLEVV